MLDEIRCYTLVFATFLPRDSASSEVPQKGQCLYEACRPRHSQLPLGDIVSMYMQLLHSGQTARRRM